MNWFTGFAVYFIIWWMTLFMVLPFGAQSQAESGEITPGTDPGAPAKNNLLRKLAINTLVAAIVYGFFYLITGPLGYSIDDIPTVFPSDLKVEQSPS